MSIVERPLTHALRTATGAVRAALRDTLADLGLTPVQNTALQLVARDPGSSPAELSRHMRVTPQTMHKLVTDLAHRGLLTLTPRENHRRILDTNLTDEGRRLIAGADARAQAIEERLAAVLSERQRRQLVTLLDHCVDALTSPPDDGPPDEPRPAARPKRSARPALERETTEV